MPRTTPSWTRPVVWRAFDARAAARIERQMKLGEAPRCPGCGHALAAGAGLRGGEPPLDAVGYDLECARCRRHHPVILHTERSLRLARMRRLAAAVAAAGPRREMEVAAA